MHFRCYVQDQSGDQSRVCHVALFFCHSLPLSLSNFDVVIRNIVYIVCPGIKRLLPTTRMPSVPPESGSCVSGYLPVLVHRTKFLAAFFTPLCSLMFILTRRAGNSTCHRHEPESNQWAQDTPYSAMHTLFFVRPPDQRRLPCTSSPSIASCLHRN